MLTIMNVHVVLDAWKRFELIALLLLRCLFDCFLGVSGTHSMRSNVGIRS